MAHCVKNVPQGQPGTPIEQARNLGPVTCRELRSIGIQTVERLREIGWQEAWELWRESYPVRNNLNAGYGIAAAAEDLDWRQLPGWLKEEVHRLRRRPQRQ